MNILVLAENYPTESTHALMYVHVRNKFYQKKGHKVTVLNFKTKNNYVYDGIKVISVESFKRNPFKRYDFLLSHAPNIKHHYFFIRRYNDYFSKIIFFFHGHEILKVNKEYPTPFAWEKKQKIHFLFNYIYDPIKLHLLRRLFCKLSSKVHFVFVSHWLYNRFRFYLKISDDILKNKVSIINNSVGAIFEQHSYHINDHKKYDFITIRSNMDSAKYSVDLVNEIAKENPDKSFLLIGKGALFEHITKAKNITHINRSIDHEEMISYINKSKTALMPTKEDTQGVMVCEMATFGIPVITSDIEVCHEMFDSFNNVVLADNDKITLPAYFKELREKLFYEKKKNMTYFAKNTLENEALLFDSISKQKKYLMYSTSKIYTATRMTGGLRRFRSLYDYLRVNGYKVDLWCGESQLYLDKNRIVGTGLSLNEKKKTALFPNLKIFIENFFNIIKIRNRYDDVIVFDVPTAISLCLLRVKNIDLFLRQDLIEYRKIIIDQKKNRIYRWFYMKLMLLCESICIKRAKIIIVQCKYDLDNLTKRHKKLHKIIGMKIYVQRNNVNVDWIEKKSLSKKKQLNDCNYKIGFVGDFSNIRKGHDILLEAVKELIDDGFRVSCYLIGDGKYLDDCKKTFRSYKDIHFLGRQDNPIVYIKAMDLLTVPSIADSCPNSALEGIYNDILTIGSKGTGVSELLKYNDLTFNLKAGDLADKIKKIVGDKKYRNHLMEESALLKKDLSFNWAAEVIYLLNGGENRNVEV